MYLIVHYTMTEKELLSIVSVSYTHLDVYKRQSLRSRIMGAGNFMGQNNITMYVSKLYNEAKFLEPPIPFKSFVRYVSKHLPREAQITLMTKDIENLSELERILDILQSIRDRETVGRPIQLSLIHIYINQCLVL